MAFGDFVKKAVTTAQKVVNNLPNFQLGVLPKIAVNTLASQIPKTTATVVTAKPAAQKINQIGTELNQSIMPSMQSQQTAVAQKKAVVPPKPVTQPVVTQTPVQPQPVAPVAPQPVAPVPEKSVDEYIAEYTGVEQQPKKEDRGDLLYTDPSGRDVYRNDLQPKTQTTAPTVEKPVEGSSGWYQQKMEENNALIDKSYNEFKEQFESIKNGTFPLTPFEQAQIQAIQDSAERAKQAQLTANKNYEGAVTQATISGGRNRYAPELALGEVKQVVDQGLAKIREIDSKAAQAVGELKSAFQNKHYEAVLDAYDRYSGFMKERQTQIGTMYNNAVQHEESLLKMEEERKKEDAEVLRKTNEQISEVLKDAAKSGASNEVLSKIANAKTVNEAIQYAGNNLSSGTGIVGEYNFYAREERAAGRTPVSFDEYQDRDANRKAVVARANAAGLNSTTQGQVLSIANKFESSDTAKNYNKLLEAKNFVDALGNTAPDDQALIYAFAKAMDPDSAVREGEYGTIQKYAQSWAEKFGFDVKRIFMGSPFLTDKARREMKETIGKKFEAFKPQYENKRNQAVKSINQITGMDDGENWIGDPEKTTSKVLKTEADYFDSLLQENPTVPFAGQQIPFQDAVAAINAMPEYQNLSDSEVMQILGVEVPEDFKKDLSMSQNGLNVDLSKAKKLSNGETNLASVGKGTVTGIDGSSYWKQGLDFVLQGGKGAKVPSPFDGTVIAAAPNGGFGNQVKIKLDDGREVWISHLDSMNVKKGQRITKGMLIGAQGNTGSVLGGSGEKLTPQQIAQGRGTHLDITMKKPDGSYYTAREVAVLLGDQRLQNIA